MSAALRLQVTPDELLALLEGLALHKAVEGDDEAASALWWKAVDALGDLTAEPVAVDGEVSCKG